MTNWTQLKTAIANVIKTNGNQEITGAVLQNTLNSIVNAVGENATFAGVATPSTNPGTSDGPVFYFATQAGTYVNFDSIALTNSGLTVLYNLTGAWNSLKVYECLQETGNSTSSPMSQKATTDAIQVEKERATAAEKTNFNNIDKNAKAIAAEVARAQEAESAIIYDVSAHNDGAVFESLSALLSSSDLNTLIPTSVRRGGITIRFIQGPEQSADNKYVQYRLMTNAWGTNIKNWQGVDDKPTVGSENLVKSGGVADGFNVITDVLFTISDEIKSAKIINNKFVVHSAGKIIGIDNHSGWSMLSIPIVKGVDYKFKYQTTGECSWYVTNSDYSTPSTIVAGRNGAASTLVNTAIIDEEKHIASFTAPINGLFNINFAIPDFNFYLKDIYFAKLSDNEYKVIGIPQSIVEDLYSLEITLQSLITDADNIFDVNLELSGYNYRQSYYPGYIGGISENKSNPAGLLTRLKSNATVTAGTRHIRVYKKVRNSSNAVTNITTVATYEIISETNWSELDVSSLNIQVPADCAVAIEQLNEDDHPALYSRSSVSESDKQILILGNKIYSPSLSGSWCGGFTFAVREKVVDLSNNQAFLNIQDAVNLHTEQITTLNEGIWSTLNVRIMGDSITWLGGDDCNQDKGWTKWFKEKANPLTCKSYARSGATLTNLNNTEYNIIENSGSPTKDNVFYNQINRLINAYDNEQDVAPDVLLVALGTNDYSRPRTPNAEAVFTANVNSYTTSESVQTMLSIAQALRYGVEILYNKFPDVQIMFLTPQQSTWNTIENREGVGNEIEQSCRYLGIPCLRLDYEAATWFIRENVSHYKTYDGTHTSVIGAKRNGYLIEKWARTKLQY